MAYKLGSLFDGSGGFPLAGALCGIEHRTLRGQVLAGDPDGAMKGLRKLLLLEGSNAIK